MVTATFCNFLSFHSLIWDDNRCRWLRRHHRIITIIVRSLPPLLQVWYQSTLCWIVVWPWIFLQPLRGMIFFWKGKIISKAMNIHPPKWRIQWSAYIFSQKATLHRLSRDSSDSKNRLLISQSIQPRSSGRAWGGFSHKSKTKPYLLAAIAINHHYLNILWLRHRIFLFLKIGIRRTSQITRMCQMHL